MATFDHQISKHLNAHRFREFFLIKLRQSSWDVFAGIAELSENGVDRATTECIYLTRHQLVLTCVILRKTGRNGLH